MDLESVILSEVREGKISYDIPHLLNLKRNYIIELTYKIETDLENEFMVASGDGKGERVVREFGLDMYTLLYLKWKTNKDLLHST